MHVGPQKGVGRDIFAIERIKLPRQLPNPGEKQVISRVVLGDTQCVPEQNPFAHGDFPQNYAAILELQRRLRQKERNDSDNHAVLFQQKDAHVLRCRLVELEEPLRIIVNQVVVAPGIALLPSTEKGAYILIQAELSNSVFRREYASAGRNRNYLSPLYHPKLLRWSLWLAAASPNDPAARGP